MREHGLRHAFLADKFFFQIGNEPLLVFDETSFLFFIFRIVSTVGGDAAVFKFEDFCDGAVDKISVMRDEKDGAAV